MLLGELEGGGDDNMRVFGCLASVQVRTMPLFTRTCVFATIPSLVEACLIRRREPTKGSSISHCMHLST